jgi:hypothetical protein
VTALDSTAVSETFRSRTAIDVVVELERRLASRSYEAIRAMYHPDARLVTMAAGSHPLPPDRAYQALMEALRRASYQPPTSIRPVAIDDIAALGAAHIRYPTEGGGHAAVRRVWLFTVKDGLLFRSITLHTEREAQDLYEREGRTLGF